MFNFIQVLEIVKEVESRKSFLQNRLLQESKIENWESVKKLNNELSKIETAQKLLNNYNFNSFDIDAFTNILSDLSELSQ